SGTATVFSSADQTLNWTQADKNGVSTGTGTGSILGGQSASSTTVSATKNGGNMVSVTVTYTVPGGGTWTAKLVIN
ncbi:MAG: hypothetical protein QOE10_2610, partial [Gaiellales bacterium]|nr:hypothetical protein [Gaiellales bacterium]